jgi:hypothetical protein
MDDMPFLSPKNTQNTAKTKTKDPFESEKQILSGFFLPINVTHLKTPGLP